MKIYIAAPFFNHEQLEQVIAVENLLDKHSIEYFSPRSFGVIKDMTEEEKQKEMHNIYLKNVEQILDSNIMIVLVDHKDTGTTWELGFAAGYNNCIPYMEDFSQHPIGKIKIITLSFTKKPVNVMLRYCIDAHAENIATLEYYLLGLIAGESMSNFSKDLEVDE